MLFIYMNDFNIKHLKNYLLYLNYLLEQNKRWLHNEKSGQCYIELRRNMMIYRVIVLNSRHKHKQQ